MAGGIMGDDGKHFGLFSYGIVAPTCQVIQHHFQVGVNVRNWGVIYTLIFFFSIGQLPLTMYFAQLFPRSQVHMAITNELWHSPVFWFMIIFITTLISLPYLGARVYRHCYLEPDIYAVEEVADPCWDSKVGCFGDINDSIDAKEVEEDEFGIKKKDSNSRF